MGSYSVPDALASGVPRKKTPNPQHLYQDLLGQILCRRSRPGRRQTQTRIRVVDLPDLRKFEDSLTGAAERFSIDRYSRMAVRFSCKLMDNGVNSRRAVPLCQSEGKDWLVDSRFRRAGHLVSTGPGNRLAAPVCHPELEPGELARHFRDGGTGDDFLQGVGLFLRPI